MSNITEPVQLAGGYAAERNKHGTAILHASGGVHMASVCEEALIGEIERLRAQVAEMREDAERWRAVQWRWDDERDMGPGGRWWAAIHCSNKPKSPEAAIDRTRKSGDGG